MTLHDCIMFCADNDELLAEFDRLAGTNLQRRGAPIELAIDDACGRTDYDLFKFIQFVKEYVYDRMPAPSPAPDTGA